MWTSDESPRDRRVDFSRVRPATTPLESRAKIVATIGPASRPLAILKAMARAGADVMRINGAHAAPSEVAAVVRDVRRVERLLAKPLAVLLDLPGVKVRIGRFAGGSLELETNMTVRLVAGSRGGPVTEPRIPVPRAVLEAVTRGSEVLLADGSLALRVLRRDGAGVLACVEAGGSLRDRVGIHVRGAPHRGAVLTARDRELAVAGVDAGVDALAVSFVRSPSDLHALRRVLDAAGRRTPILVAKLERREAIAALDAILGASDGVMVARGDLGLEFGPEALPGLQKKILDEALAHGRLAIVATQMLESMTTAVRPTRAEATDVANAIFDGADAVMLSGETAVGVHPARVVATMEGIVLAAEADPHCPFAGDPRHPGPEADPTRPDRLVVRAAVRLAMDSAADAIVVFTRGGQSARRLAKERPRCPIYAYAADEHVRRGLLLSWGVRPRHLPATKSTDATVAAVVSDLRRRAGLPSGSRVVLVMGAADDPTGATSLVKLLTL